MHSWFFGVAANTARGWLTKEPVAKAQTTKKKSTRTRTRGELRRGFCCSTWLRCSASQPRLHFALTTNFLYWKMLHFALRLSFQVSPNTVPATKSDTWTSPNTAPAKKSDTCTSPNIAPATKSDYDLTLLDSTISWPNYYVTLLLLDSSITWLFYSWLFYYLTLLILDSTITSDSTITWLYYSIAWLCNLVRIWEVSQLNFLWSLNVAHPAVSITKTTRKDTVKHKVGPRHQL